MNKPPEVEETRYFNDIRPGLDTREESIQVNGRKLIIFRDDAQALSLQESLWIFRYLSGISDNEKSFKTLGSIGYKIYNLLQELKGFRYMLHISSVQRQPKCPMCNTKGVRSEEYDAYYCEKCNIWIERKCEDKDCEFCPKRPFKPIAEAPICGQE